MAEYRDNLVEVKNLKKYYPVHRGLLHRRVGWVKAVDGVSFTIRRGETLGLVGETGSGKTTVGRLILRLLPADGGEVRFEGKPLFALGNSEMKNLRKDMQIIFQDPYGSLNPRMRAGEIVSEGLKIFKRCSRGELKARVSELLDTVGLPPEAARLYPHEFSGGQRQRVGIARALALRPKFVVCDEPVSSLDVSIQAQILNLISDLQERMGLTYLFIAHDLSVVEHISDRVAVMYGGRLLEVASSRQIYRAPLHPYTRCLLQSIPVPDPSAPPPRGEENAIGDRAEAEVSGGCRFFPRCPSRRDRCGEEIPDLKEASPDHLVACHLI